MRGLASWFRAHSLAVAVMAFVVGMTWLVLPPALDGIAGECLHEVAIGSLLSCIIVLVGGAPALLPSCAGMAHAWRQARYLLAIVSVPLVCAVVLLAAAPEELGAAMTPLSWLVALASAAALALAVAFFEETLFRGILLSAFVERMGRLRAGAFRASVAASLVFGLMHVLPALLPPSSLTPATMLVSLLRLVISTTVGMLLSALYLRTHNLWCAIAVHAANDFLLFVVAFALGGATALFGSGGEDPFDGLQQLESMGAGGGGMPSAIMFALVAFVAALVVAAYAPVMVRAVRQLRMVDASEGSIFSAAWEPRDVVDASDDTPPPPPAPMRAQDVPASPLGP